MDYGILLWPYANNRYAQALGPLLAAELALLLRRAGIDSPVERRSIAQTDWLCFRADEISPAALDILRTHSHLLLLARLRADGLDQLTGPAPCKVGEGLSSILKYKGKTSELFTRAMIGMAAGLCDFDPGERLFLLDPLCGRGTTLFEAANRGCDCAGCDVNRKDLDQGYAYFKKFLEMSRVKHEQAQDVLTVRGEKGVRRREIRYAVANGRQSMAFLEGDARAVARALKPRSVHLIVADLPYGVQHAPALCQRLDALLDELLPRLRALLKPGGAIALSFNAYTLKADALRAQLAAAGFAPFCEPPFDRLDHWVEQAVRRDLALARVPK